MIWIRLTLFGICLSLLGGCALEETEAMDIFSHEQAELQLNLEKISSIWSQAYESANLRNVIQQELERWKEPKQAIPFVIYDNRLRGREHIGLFRSLDDWELKGRSESGLAFMLQNNNGNVALTYHNQQQHYRSESFHFLLPFQHIQVIADMLDRQNYDFVSWQKWEQNWLVELHAPIKPIEFAFHDYLEHHLLDVDEEIEYQFNGFSCLYQLMLKESAEGLELKQIDFSLVKYEEPVDTLQFNF